MVKKLILLVLFSAYGLFALTLELNKDDSLVYYKAKKEIFFMDKEVTGINKSLKGDIEKIDDYYEGILYIDASMFDSDNSMRDSHVNEDFLKSDEFTYMRFDYVIEKKIAKGIMLIAGVPKQIEFPVEINENESNLNIKGSILIKYSDFAIKNPSNLISDVDETLEIGANLNFKK